MFALLLCRAEKDAAISTERTEADEVAGRDIVSDEGGHREGRPFCLKRNSQPLRHLTYGTIFKFFKPRLEIPAPGQHHLEGGRPSKK